MFNLDELGMCPLLSKTLNSIDKMDAVGIFNTKSSKRWKKIWHTAHHLAILCPMKYDEALALVDKIIRFKKKGVNVKLDITFKD